MTIRTWDPFPVLRLPSPAKKIHPENIRIRKKDWRFPTLHKTWFSVDSHLAASDPQGGSKVGPWSVLFSILHPPRKNIFSIDLYISLYWSPLFLAGYILPIFVCVHTLNGSKRRCVNLWSRTEPSELCNRCCCYTHPYCGQVYWGVGLQKRLVAWWKRMG